MKKKIFRQSVFVLATTLIAVCTQAQIKSGAERSSKNRESTTRSYESDNITGVSTIDYNDGEQSFKIKMKADKIIELYVGDKKIPEDNYGQYQETINKILIQLKRDREKAEQDQQKAMLDQQRAQLYQEKAVLDKQHAELYAVDAQKNRQQAEQYKQQAMKDELSAQSRRDRANTDEQNAMKDAERANLDQARAKQDYERAIVDKKRVEEDRQTVESLLTDIVKENIVEEKEKVFSVELTDDAFIVNGKKQSAELLAKFKVTYLKKKGTKINFNNRHFSIGNE